MRRLLLLVFPAVLLTGCAGVGQATTLDEINSTHLVSGVCSTSLVAQPNPTVPGENTRSAAVQSLVDWFRGELEQQLAKGVESQKQPPFASDDPVRLEVKIRGLEAIVDAVPQAEEDAAADSTIEVLGTFEGVKVSSATIVPHEAGGYVIESFEALAFTSDDPKCT